MDNKKLELSNNEQKATYKAIPESDMEEQAIAKARNAATVRSSGQKPTVDDGADERMLSGDDKNEIIVSDGAKISTNEKQNGDAKLDIGEIKTAFVGLTKEELMKYANDPFWVRLRWFLFVTFWLLWAAMLFGAVMIIYAAPKCDPPPPRTWWQQGPLTEIENIDANIDKLKSLQENGVQGVIVDFSDDVYLEFNDTHPIIALLKNTKSETNIIIELEPGISNKWFNLSENKHPEFIDYYIWRPPQIGGGDNGKRPPNNWINEDNQPSWTYSEERKEYFYTPHGRPQLNFRHPKVVDEFSNVLKRFIDFGAAGVRLKNVRFLLVDVNFENQTISNTPGYYMTDYGFYKHTKTENLPELANLLQKWRSVLKNLTDNGPFMAAEDLHKIESYKINNSLVIDLPLESRLFTKPNLSASDIVKGLDSVFTVDNITWPLWKYNTNDVFDIITFLLPGTPLIKNDAVINSELLRIRESASIMRGNFTYHQILNNTVFAFNRVTAGNPGFLVAYNPTNTSVIVDFPSEIPAVSEEVTVQLLSSNYQEANIDVNVKQEARSIPISSKAAVILSYVPKTS